MVDYDGIGARAVTDPNYTPNDMARDAAALIAELMPQLDKAKGKERKRLGSRIKAARILRDWARTRAGYVSG